jgi:hypothetical protein
MIGFIGPTKVVPLLQSLLELPCDVFSAACKTALFLWASNGVIGPARK